MLWSGFGGPCEANNSGDPIVLHDQLANRWLISQFAYPAFYQCIAISQTADPTGAYYRYAFQWSTNLMNDYPHFGVWPDGYYMSCNEFLNGASFAGAGAGVFERDKMLLGQSARLVAFHQNNDGGQLPSDLDGTILPPAGSPNYFADWEPGAFHIWKFHVDWTNTANSTFACFAQPAAAAFSQLCSGTRSCIPQPNTTVKLDGIGDRLMFRLAYRRFADGHESLVANHSVNAGSGRAGVRWYEVRSPGSSPVVYQQGTYAPADGLNRWMGSAAMDKDGNIGLGYSVASATTFPSIRYTGRLASDPLGTLPQGESTIKDGTGSQTGSASRWGDYRGMSIDPSDDCTFWYTTEYVQTTGATSWRTRVASFQFPTCGGTSGCTPPSGFSNNTATDISACADTGVQITWNNPSSWGDTSGTRTHDVLRNGVAIATGLSEATTSFVDNTGTNGQTYTYTIVHKNGCGSTAATSGASAADSISAPPVTQTATQSGTLSAKNSTVTAALNPAFSIALGQASSASITWSLSGSNITSCAAVRLKAPDSTETVLKA